MAKPVKRLSVRAYAKTIGVSHPTILKAIADGKIKKGVSYRMQIRNGIDVRVQEINPPIADKEFGDLHKSGRIKPGQRAKKLVSEKTIIKIHENLPLPELEGLVSEDDEALLSSIKITRGMTYADATKWRELIALAIDKKKLQEMEGALVKKDEVERELFFIGTELKKSLFNIPARVTADVRAANNDVEAQSIITVELTQVLNEFTKNKYYQKN